MTRDKGPGVFFIIGRERSGTTLLQLMLDLHSQIIIPTESPFITYLYARYGKMRFIDDHILEDFIDDLYKEPYFTMWNVSRERLKSSLLSCPERSFSKLCQAVIRSSCSADNKSEVLLTGDKNPVHSLHIPLLRKLYPDARFIYMTRDPRGQVMSMMNVNFERKDIVSLSYRWNYVNTTILRDLAGADYIHVRHEDLVVDTKEQLNRICWFLGVSYETSMLETHQYAKELIGRNLLLEAHHQSLLKQRDGSIIHKWKGAITDQQRNTIDQYTARLASRLGYERESTVSKTSFKHLASLAYGHGLFVYLRFFNLLPFSMRRFIFNRIVSRKFRFWRESAESANYRSIR